MSGTMQCRWCGGRVDHAPHESCPERPWVLAVGTDVQLARMERLVAVQVAAQALVDRLGACGVPLTLGLQPELPALEAALKAVGS